MPTLPATGLTGHWDASANTGLFKNLSGSTPVDNPADGENFAYWDDLVDATTGALSQRVLGLEGTSPSVAWHDDTAMKLPSVSLDAGKLRGETLNNIGTGAGTYFSTSGFTILISFLIDSAGTYPNSSTLYFNANLCGTGRNGFLGLFVRKSGSDYFLTGYAWDGAAKTVEVSITADVAHTACLRLASGTLSLSVDCGAESQISSGNVTSFTSLFVGDQGVASGTTAEVRGRIGEIALYNVGDAGTALAAREYLCDRWLPPEIVDEADPTLPDRSCTVSAGGGQSAGGCVVQYPTIGTQTECAGGGLVPTRADIVHSETWWGRD